jgi:hypothetical protein
MCGSSSISVLLPRDAQDGAATLLKIMTENPLFCHFALTNGDIGETHCEEWSKIQL